MFITREIMQDVADSYTDENYEFLSRVEFGEENPKGSWIQVLRCGRWNHPVYGPVEVNTHTFGDLRRNFDDNVRGIDIAVDTEHKEDKGASGWIKKLEQRGKQLWAFVEWTKKGLGLVKDKVYRYISAEFSPKYEDPETKQKFENVMVAVTLTNRPFIKKMAPIMLSEDDIYDELVERGYMTEPMEFEEGCGTDNNTRIKRNKDGGANKPKELCDPIKKKVKLSSDEMEGGYEMQFGDIESGIDLTKEDLDYLAQFSDVDPEYLYEDEDTQEYEEEEDYGNGFYDQEPAYQFSEPSTHQFVDVEARNAVMALSEQLNYEQAKSLQLEETLKFSAVEGIVDGWIETGKVLPYQRDHAIHLMMELPQNQQRVFAEFTESMPQLWQPGEVGVSNTHEFAETGSDLQYRARQLYESSQRNGQTVKFSECLRMAYKEINQ